MTKMASRPSDATVVVFQDERDHNKNDIKKKKERTNSNTIQADSKATELSLVAAGCTGCAPLRFESDGTTSFDASAGDDVTPTTSSSGSTEKSEVDSAGNNTFAAKKGKAEGELGCECRKYYKRKIKWNEVEHKDFIFDCLCFSCYSFQSPFEISSNLAHVTHQMSHFASEWGIWYY